MDAAAISDRIAHLWAVADARRDAGEPIRRNLLARLAYAPPPGDGDTSSRAWLTEDESDELHELVVKVGPMAKREAIARIRAKHGLGDGRG